MTNTVRDHRQRSRVQPTARPKVPLKRLFRVASVACGVQFGWALQLSLLTPYVQELGVSHAWASLIWLCGPVSGLVVQPLVGHLSDRCDSRFGRRTPFIFVGSVSIAVAVLIIGFAADIGWVLGDRGGGKRPRAVVVFVLGFWLLDVANNVIQGPCRALLGDLSGKDQRRTRIANAYFSLFMAVGNILGYATGSYSGWHTILPFTLTSSCSINCANLKSAFLLDIVLLALTTYISISAAQEMPSNSCDQPALSLEEREQLSGHDQEAPLWELLGSFRYLPLKIWMVLIVTALTWIGWFPFLMFDTDWMGREVYRGTPEEGKIYHTGVTMGAFGLMLNSVVLGLTSVVMEKLCRKWGAGLVWGVSNVLMSFCFGVMLIISFLAKSVEFSHSGLPPVGIVIAALFVFAALGVPLAVTYSVPYAMISTYTVSLGLGQGLSMGILNLAIVFPQVIVSLGSGPLDQLAGGGNSPAFAVAAVAALVGGLVAILGLPRSQTERLRSLH